MNQKHSSLLWNMDRVNVKCTLYVVNVLIHAKHSHDPLMERITSVADKLPNQLVLQSDSYSPAASRENPSDAPPSVSEAELRGRGREGDSKFTSLTTNTRLGCTDWILTAGFGRPDLLCVFFLNIQGALLQPCWATKRKMRRRKRQESSLLFAATLQVGLRYDQNCVGLHMEIKLLQL